MNYVIKQSESGDWFLVPLEYDDSFYEDELEEKADYAQYIGSPDSIVITGYRKNA